MNSFTDVVLEVIKDVPAWPGRHLLEGGEDRRYFGLKTVMRGVVEFECRNQRCKRQRCMQGENES